MKKIISIIALSVILTACAKTEPPKPVIETTAAAPKTAAITFEKDDKYEITGAYGETLDLREADKFYYTKFNEETKESEEIPLTLDEAINADYYIVEFNGFCYAAKPSGICYSVIDNPDMFEYVDGRPRIKQEIAHEYKFERVNVGETYSGFTVKEANYIFSVQSGNFSELIYSGMFYEGEATMNGYATCALMSEGYMLAGNIYFYPENSPDIPTVTNPKASLDLNWLASDINNYEDFTWFYSDGGFTSLGSVTDEKYRDVDIPTDGSIFRITATIRNLDTGYSDVSYVPERAEKSECLKIIVD